MLHAEVARSAGAILDRADVPHGLITGVDRDSILFRGKDGVGIYTAWLHGAKVMMVQTGFVAEEPPGLHPAPTVSVAV